MHTPTTHIIKLAEKKFAVVTEYCHHGGSGCRQGFWAPDVQGGWGVSSKSSENAVAECAQPVTYPTRRAAEVAAMEADLA